MSYSKPSRSRLIELEDHDLSTILRSTTLAAAWAQFACVKSKDLQDGRPRALVSLRVAMRRDTDKFIDVLVEDMLERIAEEDPSSGRTHYDNSSIADAGPRLFGGPATDALLLWVSEASPVDPATHFNPPAASDEHSEADTRKKANEMDATPGDESALRLVLERTRSLLVEGASLCEGLRGALADVEHGRPADSMGHHLDAWSSAVREHLTQAETIASAEDLYDLETRLGTYAAQHAAKRTSAYEVSRQIAVLHDQGLDDLIPDLLRRRGFETVDEVEVLLRERDSPLSAIEPEIDGPAPNVVVQGPVETASEERTFDDVPPRERFESELIDHVDTGTVVDSPPAASDFRVDNSTATAKDSAGTSESATDPTQQELAPSAGPQAGGTLSRRGLVATAQQMDPGDPVASIGPSVGPKTDTVAVELPDFPWDEGTPPLVAQLLLEHRDGLAYFVAAAAEETELRQQLLKMQCTAAGCTATVLELSLPQLIPSETEIEHLRADECRVLLAASLWAGLKLGYAPLGMASLIDRCELTETGLAPLVRAVADAVQRGYIRQPSGRPHDTMEISTRWMAFAVESDSLRDSLQLRRTKYHRATRILQHMGKEQQPVGSVLKSAALLARSGANATSDPRWGEIESVAAQLRDPADRDRLIADADVHVSTGPQRRNPIIAGALARLHGHLDEVATLLTDGLALRRATLAAADTKILATIADLERELADAPSDIHTRTVGDAALYRLVEWLRSPAPAPEYGSVDELLNQQLLPLYELPRDSDGRPLRNPTAIELLQLTVVRPPRDVVSGYLEAGNIAGARAFLAKEGLEAGEWDDEILRATQAAELQHRRVLADTDRKASRLRALYYDDDARRIAERADALRVLPDRDRFDLTMGPLQELADEAGDLLKSIRGDLRRRAESLKGEPVDRDRILELIDSDDEILAVEFLTLVDNDQALPKIEPSKGDDFGQFFPGVVDVAADAAERKIDPVAAVRESLGAMAEPDDRQLRSGLLDWINLRDNKRHQANQAFRVSVANILRMVGLVPRAQDWMREITRTQRSGYATFQVSARPVDRSYVPQFGTQANGTYHVTLAWDNIVNPSRLLDFVEEGRTTQPNVIFYFGVFNVDQRLQLRRLTLPGNKGFSPLVVDQAVIAWLSTRQEPGWRFTQRVTLPFTTLNPYTPFAGGEVPDEVFVGRSEERGQIESPTGSMFVYGGRQLGKSALLRKVERMFTDRGVAEGTRSGGTGNIAIYVDLKAAGIGDALEPGALWPLLGERLKELDVMPAKTSRNPGPDVVAAQIKRWIDSDPANRMLLLLDESDNFLTADSKNGVNGGAFPVLQRLKGIMESSNRRFKTVFAGLHQVQRFHDSNTPVASNTPIGHGGNDILIGPLRSLDAYSLVADPMQSLGYAFESPELVWRLLLLTNYQASLVQIVCEALVRHLQQRQLPRVGGMIVIDDRDIEEVSTKQAVRDLLAQRFRWTINLDSRYRVIALVVALRSLEATPGSAFAVDDLHEECEAFWPVGFNRDELTGTEFKRYLDEMVGLGVLHQSAEFYGLRSPNIIRMLGTTESLNQELADAAKHLEPALEYNPTMNRRVLGSTGDLAAARSPLTDHDLATLLKWSPADKGQDSRKVQAVLGSAALGVHRVADAIGNAATTEGIRWELWEWPEALKRTRQPLSGRVHAIVDGCNPAGTPKEIAELNGVADAIRARGGLSATIILGPELVPVLHQSSLPVLPLRRWSLSGLRAWHESPFDTPELRLRLHRVTSGWPELIEEAMRLVARGTSPHAALQSVADAVAGKERARKMVNDCGVDAIVADRWATWFGAQGSDGLQEASPASLTDLTEALEIEAAPVVARYQRLDLVTETEDGWTLDRVVITAATAVRR